MEVEHLEEGEHFPHLHKITLWEFPGGAVIRTQRFHCCGPGSVSGHGTKVLKAAWWGKKKKKKNHRMGDFCISSGWYPSQFALWLTQERRWVGDSLSRPPEPFHSSHSAPSFALPLLASSGSTPANAEFTRNSWLPPSGSALYPQLFLLLQHMNGQTTKGVCWIQVPAESEQYKIKSKQGSGLFSLGCTNVYYQTCE